MISVGQPVNSPASHAGLCQRPYRTIATDVGDFEMKNKFAK